MLLTFLGRLLQHDANQNPGLHGVYRLVSQENDIGSQFPTKIIISVGRDISTPVMANGGKITSEKCKWFKLSIHPPIKTTSRRNKG